MVEYIGVRAGCSELQRVQLEQQQDGGWAFGGDGRRSRGARLSNEMRFGN